MYHPAAFNRNQQDFPQSHFQPARLGTRRLHPAKACKGHVCRVHLPVYQEWVMRLRDEEFLLVTTLLPFFCRCRLILPSRTIRSRVHEQSGCAPAETPEADSFCNHCTRKGEFLTCTKSRQLADLTLAHGSRESRTVCTNQEEDKATVNHGHPQRAKIRKAPLSCDTPVKAQGG